MRQFITCITIGSMFIFLVFCMFSNGKSALGWFELSIWFLKYLKREKFRFHHTKGPVLLETTPPHPFAGDNLIKVVCRRRPTFPMRTDGYVPDNRIQGPYGLITIMRMYVARGSGAINAATGVIWPCLQTAKCRIWGIFCSKALIIPSSGPWPPGLLRRYLFCEHVVN